MLLDYARPPTVRCKLGLSVLTGAAGLLCGGVAVWCAVHTAHFVSVRIPAGCGTCREAQEAALGMPPGRAVPLGVFSGGCALVAGVQAIRFANGARDRVP